MERQYRCGRYL